MMQAVKLHTGFAVCMQAAEVTRVARNSPGANAQAQDTQNACCQSHRKQLTQAASAMRGDRERAPRCPHSWQCQASQAGTTQPWPERASFILQQAGTVAASHITTNGLSLRRGHDGEYGKFANSHAMMRQKEALTHCSPQNVPDTMGKNNDVRSGAQEQTAQEAHCKPKQQQAVLHTQPWRCHESYGHAATTGGLT